jgi:hypothetical protein
MPVSLPQGSALPPQELYPDQQGNLAWDGSVIGWVASVGGPIGSGNFDPSLWGNAPPELQCPTPYFQINDDFLQQATATSSLLTWTDVKGTGGTNAFSATNSGGVYNLVTAASADDYRGIRSANKAFMFAAGKRAWVEMRFKCFEATTNQSAIAMGFMDATTTGGIQTGSSGPLTSFSGAIMYKPANTLNVQAMTSQVTNQVVQPTFATLVSNTWSRFGFYFDGGINNGGASATSGTVTPYADVGSGWVASTTALTIAFSNLAQMYLFATIKAGSSAGAETLQIDYIQATQLR